MIQKVSLPNRFPRRLPDSRDPLSRESGTLVGHFPRFALPDRNPDRNRFWRFGAGFFESTNHIIQRGQPGASAARIRVGFARITEIFLERRSMCSYGNLVLKVESIIQNTKDRRRTRPASVARDTRTPDARRTRAAKRRASDHVFTARSILDERRSGHGTEKRGRTRRAAGRACRTRDHQWTDTFVKSRTGDARTRLDLSRRATPREVLRRAGAAARPR